MMARRMQPAFLRWGLIPPWAKDPKIGNRMINARAETVAEKPSFRRALARRRCLVLSDGFLEWRKHGGKKTPVRVVLKSGEPFAFAGLWETWRPRGGEAIRSCTIITTEPNSFMEPIHNRMPVNTVPRCGVGLAGPGHRRCRSAGRPACAIPVGGDGSLPGIHTGQLSEERPAGLHRPA